MIYFIITLPALQVCTDYVHLCIVYCVLQSVKVFDLSFICGISVEMWQGNNHCIFLFKG